MRSSFLPVIAITALVFSIQEQTLAEEPSAPPQATASVQVAKSCNVRYSVNDAGDVVYVGSGGRCGAIPISANAIKQLAAFKSITSLYTSWNGDPEVFREIGKMTQLESLRVTGSTQKPAVGIEHLKGLKKLKVLNVGPPITEDEFAKLGDLPQLEELRVQASPLTAKTLARVSRWPHLKALAMNHWQVSNEDMHLLAGCKELNSLQLPNNIDDTALHNFRNLKQLEWLRGDGLSISGVLKLKMNDHGSTFLEGLHAKGVYHNLDDQGRLETLLLSAPMDADAVAMMNEHAKPLKLYIRTDTFDDELLAQFTASSRLESLDLSGSRCTKAALAHLHEMPRLKSLRLPSACDDSWMPTIAALTDLEAVDFRSSQVIGTGIAALNSMPRLRSLNLELHRDKRRDKSLHPNISQLVEDVAKFSKLRDLTMRHFPIQDKDLKAITRLQALESLNLNSTKISTAGLEEFRALPRLEKLQVYGTGIPSRVVREFLTSHVNKQAQSPVPGAVSVDTATQ